MTYIMITGIVGWLPVVANLTHCSTPQLIFLKINVYARTLQTNKFNNAAECMYCTTSCILDPILILVIDYPFLEN